MPENYRPPDKTRFNAEGDVVAHSDKFYVNFNDLVFLKKEPTGLSVTSSLLKAGRNVIGEALNALDKIPATDGKIPVPWPIGKRPILEPEQWAESEIESLPINELTATQRTLNVETVRAYIKTPGAIEENRRAFANVYANSDGLMIVDGHHRLAALWLLGADHANVWFLGE